MLEILCVLSLLGVAGVIYKLLHYRAAIIQLQADMTLVLNELTRPILKQRFITCNQCVTVLTPEEFAHHNCRRVSERAEAMSAAQKIHVPESYEERLALHKHHEHAI